MGLKHSLKQLEKIAEETTSEITFMEDGTISWFWCSLRFQPKVEDVPKLIQAIAVLTDEIGFEQQ